MSLEYHDDIAALWFARALELYADKLDDSRRKGRAQVDQMQGRYEGDAGTIFEGGMEEASRVLRVTASNLRTRVPATGEVQE